jgi:hypothetical protein
MRNANSCKEREYGQGSVVYECVLKAQKSEIGQESEAHDVPPRWHAPLEFAVG